MKLRVHLTAVRMTNIKKAKDLRCSLVMEALPSFPTMLVTLSSIPSMRKDGGEEVRNQGMEEKGEEVKEREERKGRQDYR